MARVFVLDDEETIARTWGLILSKQGHETTLFLNAESALDAIRQDPPDLLVSDVGLPRMNGIELAMTLKNEGIPTRVLLCSGQTVTTEYLEEATQKGFAFRVLAKPVGPPVLIAQVSEMLNGAEKRV